MIDNPPSSGGSFYPLLLISIMFFISGSFVRLTLISKVEKNQTDVSIHRSINYTRPNPFLTIGATLFKINNPGIYHDTLNAISSWLSSSPGVRVYFYDIEGGMGNLSQSLIKELQDGFGKERVYVKGYIQKRLPIEDLQLLLERIEDDCETPLCALVNTDIIISKDILDYLYAVDEYFGDTKNWSIHFPRENLNPSCRSKVNIDIIKSSNWSDYLHEIVDDCHVRIQPYGWDIFLWNRLGISMHKANIPRYLYGRPHFEYAIAIKSEAQGYYVTTYPYLFSYHLDHPERSQVQFNPKHPHALYNQNLNKINKIGSFPNRRFLYRMNNTHFHIKVGSHWIILPLKNLYNVPLSYPGFK